MALFPCVSNQLSRCLNTAFSMEITLISMLLDSPSTIRWWGVFRPHASMVGNKSYILRGSYFLPTMQFVVFILAGQDGRPDKDQLV